MLLTIDVGNTNTVSGVYEDKKLLHHWRIKTDRRETADELSARFHSLFTMNEISFENISSVVIASVVPTQQIAWIEFCKKIGWPMIMVDSKTKRTGITIRTDHPAEVGADRIVNAIAALDKYRSDIIVVDFGTAITFDCVSNKKEYLGGAIVPGIGISIDALASHTAKLPRVDISSPPNSAIGTNTVDAIKSGLLYGYASLVDGMINRLKNEFNSEKQIVIATGGMSELIAPYVQNFDAVDPLLTLQGLRLIHEQQGQHDR